MRKVIVTLIVIAVIIATGCTTTSTAENKTIESNTVEEKSAAVVAEKPQENVKKPVTAIVEIPYIVKETSYFSDGYIESYKVFTFFEDMTPAREDLFDSFDEIIESVVYESTSANEVKRELFDSRGSLQSWKKLINNDRGDTIRLESYNSEDQLQSVSEYLYDDEGRKASWRVLDADGIVLSDTRYIYEQERNTRIEIYNESAVLQEYFVSEYGPEGILRKTHYADDDKVIDAVEYVYEGGSLVAERHLRANGSVSRTARFTNDGKGSPVKIEYFDGNGKLKDWSALEYEYVSKEITVWK